MTDPNVIEALRLIAARVFRYESSSQRTQVDILLAAAEKPAAESVATSFARIGALVSVPVTETQAQRDGVFARVFDLTKKPAEAAPVVPPAICEALHLPSDATGAEAVRAIGRLPAPVAPALPWVVRDTLTKHVFARCPMRINADTIRAFIGPARYEVVEVATAPTVAAVVPVKFVADRQAPLEMGASGPGWVAAFSIPARRITLDIDLRPGEDAGETAAKMLAPVGRGP